MKCTQFQINCICSGLRVITPLFRNQGLQLKKKKNRKSLEIFEFLLSINQVWTYNRTLIDSFLPVLNRCKIIFLIICTPCAKVRYIFLGKKDPFSELWHNVIQRKGKTFAYAMTSLTKSNYLVGNLNITIGTLYFN